MGRRAALCGWLLAAPAAAFAQEPASSPAPAAPAAAESATASPRFLVQGQTTFVYQGHDSFRSPYRGANSLAPKAQGRETWDATLLLGLRLWPGAELWLNSEIDQGFGLSDTVGVVGFPNGEAYRKGAADPYFRVPRVFIRQTLNLGGETQAVEADQNQFPGSRRADRVVITFGKFAVGDVFDTNRYAHDPRSDFLNWAVIDAGTFDYAADAWGYTAGAAVEWYRGSWTLRGGTFLLSSVPNGDNIDLRFRQFQLVGEVERRHTLLGHPGKVMLTSFLNRGRMGRLNEATALGEATGTTPSVAPMRRYAGRAGVHVSLEQQFTDDLGVFARLGWADGRFEAYEFTDIDRSVSLGLSLAGKRWGRAEDTIGLAGVLNQASSDRERYLAAGGLGILAGDGRLPHPGREKIAELYYDVAVRKGAHVALNYQRVASPAYDRDRGPVNLLAVRLHGEF